MYIISRLLRAQLLGEGGVEPKDAASVCSACWESAVPYAMGQVQGPDSGVVSDMERPRQDPYPDGAGECDDDTERAWAKVGDSRLGVHVGVGSWAKRYLNRKEGQKRGTRLSQNVNESFTFFYLKWKLREEVVGGRTLV